MTPVAESYTISKELTGYTEDQTITPNELTLWRVLQINQDGTIEIISEYTSSNEIYFKGEVGYRNCIGVLNDIASTYTNSKYTIGSRYPGYNGQTEFITKSLSTESINAEAFGAGYNIYNNDLNLIQSVLNTKIAYSINQQEFGKTPVAYWMSGHSVQAPYNADYNFDVLFTMIFVRESGVTGVKSMYGYGGTHGNISFGGTYFIRPIVILKTNLSAHGQGTQENPWTFN